MTEKFSLQQQLEEIDRELALRDKVYPRLVQRREMRQSVADYHMGRLRAVRATLEWLARNEAEIIAAVEERKRESTPAST